MPVVYILNNASEFSLEELSSLSSCYPGFRAEIVCSSSSQACPFFRFTQSGQRYNRNQNTINITATFLLFIKLLSLISSEALIEGKNKTRG